MKAKISLLLAVLLTAAVFCGCAKTTKPATADEPSPTVETAAVENVRATEQMTETTPTEVPTVPKSTDPPATEAPTQAPKTEYYAVDLVTKPLSEIIEIMGNDYEVEFEGEHMLGITSGGVSIYNNTTLPGFAFFVGGDPASDSAESIKKKISDGTIHSYNSITVYGNAKYNESISADMTYLEVSKVIGSYELAPLVGSATIRQNIDSKATVYYNAHEIDEEKAKSVDPGIKGISVQAN